MSDFTQLVDLASERLRGRVLEANDEFFAPKENLLKTAPPIFLEHKYTSRGKWMDGWETRRRRTPGFDWCVVQLGLPGVIRGVVVDTRYFRGNYPELCSLEACALARRPTAKQFSGNKVKWVEILPKRMLKGDALNPFSVASAERFTHVRLKIYPDGGVARLRVHGEVSPDWKRILRKKRELDLAAVENGGRIISASDQFFSSPQNLLMPERAMNMGDGWETKRRRGPGFDWVIVQLGTAAEIRSVVVETNHFKGNFPESCALEAWHAPQIVVGDVPFANLAWKELLSRTKLRANARHIFRKELHPVGKATHVRFSIYPDGGVARLRIFGVVPPPTVSGIENLNSLPHSRAREALRACCGSAEWVRRMTTARPFADQSQLFEAAERMWLQLGRKDWLEAFHHHPRIGEQKTAATQSAQARRWSAGEQEGAARSAAETKREFAKANRAYEARFGYIFIVCAAGKPLEEILALLRERMLNDAETELHIAAEEHRKITRLRLEKLIAP